MGREVGIDSLRSPCGQPCRLSISASLRFGEAAAPVCVVGGDGGFSAGADVEAAVFPGEEVGGFAGAEVLAVAEGMEEAVAEEFGHGAGVGGGHAVEAAFFVEEAIGGEVRCDCYLDRKD